MAPLWTAGWQVQSSAGQTLAMRLCCQSPGAGGHCTDPALSSASTTCSSTSHASCLWQHCPFTPCSTPLPVPVVPPLPRAPSWHVWLPGMTSLGRGEALSPGCPGTRRPRGSPRSRVGWGKPYAPARGAGADASPAAHRGWRGVAGGGRGLLRTGVQYLAGCRGGGGGIQLTAARKEERKKRRGERQRAEAAP